MKKMILMLMLFAPIATFAQKFGHVNAQAVMESLPEFIKADRKSTRLNSSHTS